jgi:hypothetical protein
MNSKAECLDFFNNYFLTPKYQELKKQKGIVYIRKIARGIHMGQGVQPVDPQEEENLKAIFQNGEECGINQEKYLIQSYIDNPLLLYGHKFDFRMYMLVASVDPLIVFYHDGFLRVSLHLYNVNATDKAALLTNTEFSKALFEEASSGKLVHGMNETELRNFQMWTLERLQAYLLSSG